MQASTKPEKIVRKPRNHMEDYEQVARKKKLNKPKRGKRVEFMEAN